jgi:hypothetical protein
LVVFLIIKECTVQETKLHLGWLISYFKTDHPADIHCHRWLFNDVVSIGRVYNVQLVKYEYIRLEMWSWWEFASNP